MTTAMGDDKKRRLPLPHENEHEERAMSRDDGDARTAPRPRKLLEFAPRFGLRIIGGNDTGKTIRIDSNRKYLIGQSTLCELVLADREVSRRHASVEIEGERLHFVDLDSTNGSWLGSVAVGDARLSGGERIAIGGSMVLVERLPNGPIEPLDETDHFGAFLGSSVAVRRLYALFARLAASDVPLVIEGETGTGKEVLAYSLHAEGPRRDGPFIVVDCAGSAIEELEAEISGSESTPSAFERARGGTLVLDEVAELSAKIQPKLLRLVETTTMSRRAAPGSATATSDVRILSTTSRDLDREVQEGRFREDLLHRLCVARVELPPLRARREDIALLARHFCEAIGGPQLPAELIARWEGASWTGNARELRNAVSRWVALGELEGLKAAPGTAVAEGWMDDLLAQALPLAEARQRVVEEFERRYVAHLLSKTGGNVAQAAASAGMSRRYLQMLKVKLGI
jgi:transcriptional regulator with AAA-type ATPase domain